MEPNIAAIGRIKERIQEYEQICRNAVAIQETLQCGNLTIAAETFRERFNPLTDEARADGIIAADGSTYIALTYHTFDDRQKVEASALARKLPKELKKFEKDKNWQFARELDEDLLNAFPELLPRGASFPRAKCLIDKGFMQFRVKVRWFCGLSPLATSKNDEWWECSACFCVSYNLNLSCFRREEPPFRLISPKRPLVTKSPFPARIGISMPGTLGTTFILQT